MTTTQAATVADEATVAISEMIQDTEKMKKWVEALLTQSKSPNAALATWMGSELEQMPPDVWDQCRDETYDVIRVWKISLQQPLPTGTGATAAARSV